MFAIYQMKYTHNSLKSLHSKNNDYSFSTDDNISAEKKHALGNDQENSGRLIVNHSIKMYSNVFMIG